MNRLRRVLSALAAAGALFIVGLAITCDLIYRAVTGKEGL